VHRFASDTLCGHLPIDEKVDTIDAGRCSVEDHVDVYRRVVQAAEGASVPEPDVRRSKLLLVLEDDSDVQRTVVRPERDLRDHACRRARVVEKRAERIGVGPALDLDNRPVHDRELDQP